MIQIIIRDVVCPLVLFITVLVFAGGLRGLSLPDEKDVERIIDRKLLEQRLRDGR